MNECDYQLEEAQKTARYYSLLNKVMWLPKISGVVQMGYGAKMVFEGIVVDYDLKSVGYGLLVAGVGVAASLLAHNVQNRTKKGISELEKMVRE